VIILAAGEKIKKAVAQVEAGYFADEEEALWLSYSLCDNFNLYKSDQSLCPLCLCGSFHSLASRTVP
jgi:hypothetical protein